MSKIQKLEIARFSPVKAVAQQALSLAVGLCLATIAMVAALNILTSDWITPRSQIAAPLMLVLFGVAAICVFGRGLIDDLRSGTAVEVESGKLRAFTVGFGEMQVSEICSVKVTGRGKTRRVIVFGEAGPRLVIRADIMSSDARNIAQAIMDTKALT